MPRTLTLALAALLALSLVSCGDDDDADPTPSLAPAAVTPTPTSVPTGATDPPNATPVPGDTTGFQLTNFVDDADVPSKIAFAPDGRMFYAELHTGRIRVVENANLRTAPFADLDVVYLTDRYSEHGLLGLALDPDFESNGYVYAFISVPDEDGEPVEQQVVRLTDADSEGTDLTVIVDDLPIGSNNHNGGRIAFGDDGALYVSIGDTANPDSSQDPDDLRGKILRYNPDGTVPDDNPVPGNPMWALGVRNTFGLAFDSDGTLWATENSDSGNDEVNRIVEAGNYGWPEVTGVNGDQRFADPLAASGDESWAPTGITVAPNGDLYFCSFNRGTLLHINAAGPHPHRHRLRRHRPALRVRRRLGPRQRPLPRGRRRDPPLGPAVSARQSILIVCTGNRARSQMGEGLLRHFAGDRFDVYSAGTEPKGLADESIAAMAEIGIDISAQTSDHISKYEDMHFDYLITVCSDACAVLPPRPTATVEAPLGHRRPVRHDQARPHVCRRPSASPATASAAKSTPSWPPSRHARSGYRPSPTSATPAGCVGPARHTSHRRPG